MLLTERERIEILMMLGYGNRRRTYREVANLFNGAHPERNPISHSAVAKTYKRYQNFGTVKNNLKAGRPKSATSDDMALDILISVNDEPKTSSTQLALNNNISQTSVMRIMKREKIRPYKVTLIHELSEDDPDRRMQFCDLFMGLCNDNENFINNVLFSDEATFCLAGFVNRHNCRYWSFENPHWAEEYHTQHPQKINVWAGIIGERIVGPFFMNENLTGTRYLNLLQNEIVPALTNLFPNENGELDRHIWFQQDGAPAHFELNVRQFLNDTFENRWIGRRGSIEWPARSPDLSPLDFFLWGHLKSVVYKEKPNDLEQLKTRITRAIQEITPEQLQNSVKSVRDRLAHCQAVNGSQFEHLL